MCKLKRYEEAIKDYDAAIALDGFYELAYFHRGQTYFILKKYEKSRLDFIKALDINPKNDEAREKLIELQDYVVE